jgi:glycosyltransferase involved in cell wall biosynthesis
VEWGNEIEQRALDRAGLVLYPSAWAAASAQDDYGVGQHKIRILPYGANLDRVPDPSEIYCHKSSSRCTATFLGVDWERKGGSIAYDAVEVLRRMGIDAHLNVIGCTPPKAFKAGWMTIKPRIDTGDPDGAEELATLLLASNFLLLPTRSECYGLVFCEASAHGTPSIATDTGGVSGVVQEGENGFLLSPSATGREYAALIADLFRAPERYGSLVSSSRHAFDSRLNWRAWGTRAAHHIANAFPDLRDRIAG